MEDATELILNADGSVYHLGLLPGQIAETIITVGDPGRVAQVSRHWDAVEFRQECREFVTHTGRLGHKRLTAISTGIGTDNVDIVLNELHHLHAARDSDEGLQIIRLGTSGALQEDIPLHSILISEAAIGLDGLLHFYQWQNNQEEIEAMLATDERWKKLPRPYGARAGRELLPKFSDLAELSGVTVTAPGFYAPQGRHVHLPPRVPDLLNLLAHARFDGQPLTNLEMETAGIYGLCSLLGHQAVSLSAILANRVTGQFAEDPETTIEAMIQKALERMESL